MEQNTANEQYVFLRAGKLRLLVPQTEIGVIGHLEGRPEPSGMPGLLAVPGRDDACYLVLDEEFRLMESCPEDRYVTTSLPSADGMETLWVWNEARVLLDFDGVIEDMPDVLLRSASPLRRFTLLEEQPVFVCSAETLNNLALGAGQ